MDTTQDLKNLKARVEKLEKAVFGNARRKPEVKNPNEFKGATGGLRFLISKGFFNRKRDFGEIRKELEGNDYNYSHQAVQTPLNNLSKHGGPLVGLKKGGKKVYAKRK